MSNADLLPTLLFKINQIQLALEAAIIERTQYASVFDFSTVIKYENGHGMWVTGGHARSRCAGCTAGPQGLHAIAER